MDLNSQPIIYPRNIACIVAYDGMSYHGWQRQAPGIDTVQERLEVAATHVLRHPVCVNGAGRTDAGVHAAGQVANFRTTNLTIPAYKVRMAMNSRLPPDIAIISSREVPVDFHSSLSAVGKTYRYRLYLRTLHDVAKARVAYHFWRELDIGQMRLAARRLIGRHDFRAFAFSAEHRENTVRTLTAVDLSEVDMELEIRVTGTGFLYKMVRNIVGTLIEIGRGRWAPDEIDRILASRQRRYAGFTAPAHGLCLMHVDYPPEAMAFPPGGPTSGEAPATAL